MMEYKDLGYDAFFEESRTKLGFDAFDIGRVISEHKERYIVKTETNEFEAEVISSGQRFLQKLPRNGEREITF